MGNRELQRWSGHEGQREGIQGRCLETRRSEVSCSLAWQADLHSEFSVCGHTRWHSCPSLSLWWLSLLPRWEAWGPESGTSCLRSLRVKERTSTRSWVFWLLVQRGFFWFFFFSVHPNVFYLTLRQWESSEDFRVAWSELTDDIIKPNILVTFSPLKVLKEQSRTSPWLAYFYLVQRFIKVLYRLMR